MKLKLSVAHDCCDNAAAKNALTLKPARKHPKYHVAINDVPLTVDKQNTVCVAVIGDANICVVFFNRRNQRVKMHHAIFLVYVQSVRLIADQDTLALELFSQKWNDRRRGTVCTIKYDPHARESVSVKYLKYSVSVHDRETFFRNHFSDRRTIRMPFVDQIAT